MASPVTGPFFKNGGNQSWWWQKWKYKQAKPRNQPLPYRHQSATVFRAFGTNTPDAASKVSQGLLVDPTVNWAAQKAFDRFKEAARESATVGASLAEGREAMGMVANRVLSLVRFTRKLNRFDFPGAAKELSMPRPPRGGTKSGTGVKSLSKYWLEYHFGWEPLVKDIGAAIKVFESPYNNTVVKGSAKFQRNQNYSWVPGSSQVQVMGIQTIAYVKYGAEIAVTNPNLALATQLGFVNPLAIAWELVPFSFVIDWFVNVGDFLSSATDLCGLSLTKSYTTQMVKQRRQNIVSYYNWIEDFESTQMDRSLGITLPSFGLKPPRDLGVSRGATAVALLVGMLKNLK